jgi:DNA-binding XRE family transcriptional regulator
MTQKYNYVDPDDNTFTVVCRHPSYSQAEIDKRRLYRLRNYSQIQEKLADPMEAYFYFKEMNDIATAKRNERLPKNNGKTLRELIHEVQLRSNNDRMPLILKNGKGAGSTMTVQRKMVKNTRNKQSNRFQKQLETNADAGLLKRILFEQDFIQSVKAYRKNKALTQAELAKRLNVKEYEIRAFERNELIFDAGLKALLAAQLSN